MPTSLRARFIFPVDRPPIENGVVTIEGDEIVDLGNKSATGKVVDLGSVALLPGLVNAHTHLEFSYLHEPLGNPGMSLVDWIRLVIAERARGNQNVRSAFAAGRSECQVTGTTSIGNIATSSTIQDADITNFSEVISFSRARAESAFNALTAGMNEVLADELNGQVTENIASKFGISPHAPYTVSPGLLKKLVELSQRLKCAVAMHIAESREELQLLRDGAGPFQQLLEERSMWDAEAIPSGSSPFDYLTMLAHAPHALIIHGNYLDDDELQFLATHRDRMSLVYCPRTHAYFRHPAYPLAKALASGVRVALGTDSRASNPDLSLLSEMRFVAQTHPSVDPDEVLRMGTLFGAKALGRDNEVGTITPGKAANLVAVRLPDSFASNARDALTHLLNSQEQVSAVWLRGTKLEKPCAKVPRGF